MKQFPLNDRSSTWDFDVVQLMTVTEQEIKMANHVARPRKHMFSRGNFVAIVH